MSSPLPNQEYTYYRVGMLDDFMERIGRRVRVEHADVALFKTSEGEVFALENKSPGPRGGTLVEGIVSGKTLYDPICDWRIQLTDGRVMDPDTGQVQTYPVQIEDGEVRVGIPDGEGGANHG